MVHYEIEATVLGEAGEPIVAERSENVKVIRLKTLTDSSDIERLAGDILSKCKLIHESKLGRVEDLLRQLQQGQAKARRSVRDGVGGGAISRARQAAQVGALSNSGSSAHVGTPSGSGEVAQLSRLDDYVECMYDGTECRESNPLCMAGGRWHPCVACVCLLRAWTSRTCHLSLYD